MKPYGFGVDVGGTTIKMGLFKTDGTLVEKWEIPTDNSQVGVHIIPDIASAIEEKMIEHRFSLDDIEGIGVGVPGAVSNGICNRAVNLGWNVVHVETELSRISKMRVKLGNDANVAALGESWMGSGKDYNSIVMVTLGTGVGGGVVIDHKIVEGAGGAAGEIGHIVMDPTEKLACNCGRHGCLEQFTSATGFARMAKRALEASDAPSSLRSIDDLIAKDLFDAAKEGDALAQQVVSNNCDILGRALAYISCVVAPDAFLIGGGVSKAGQYLIDEITAAYKNYAFHASVDTPILTASLGNDAGIYGAMRMLLV